MSTKYPWLPEAVASPLRRVRNSIAFRIKNRPRHPLPPTRAELEALQAELAAAKARADRWFRRHQKLSGFVMDASRAARGDRVASAALDWIRANDYASGSDVANGPKERPYQELTEAIDAAASRKATDDLAQRT